LWRRGDDYEAPPDLYATTGMWRSHMRGVITGGMAGETLKKNNALLPIFAVPIMV